MAHCAPRSPRGERFPRSPAVSWLASMAMVPSGPPDGRGRMDQEELLAALVAAQRDGRDLRRAWLLIALGRYREAVDAAEQAQHQHRSQPGLGQCGGMVLWQASAAQAVAYLAGGQWVAAERATQRALLDFGEETAY